MQSQGFLKCSKRRLERTSKEGKVRRAQSTIAGCEDGGLGPPTKGCRWLLGAKNSKVVDSPLELPERNAALLTP